MNAKIAKEILSLLDKNNKNEAFNIERFVFANVNSLEVILYRALQINDKGIN